MKKLASYLSLDYAIIKEVTKGKALSLTKRCLEINQVCEELGDSECRTCRVLNKGILGKQDISSHCTASSGMSY